MDAYIKKVKNKLVFEGLIKSAALSAVIAAICATFIALIVWLAPTNASVTWVAVGIFLGLTVAVTPVLYFFKFRVTELEMARRLDRMGLDERMVTMYEYSGTLVPSAAGVGGANGSILAMQAADATKSLGSLVKAGTTAGLISITASTIVPLVIALVPFGGMVTVGALVDTEVIPTGYEIIRQVADPVTEKFYTVNYRAALLDLQTNMYTLDAGGFIDGDDEQLVAYTVNGDNEVLSTSAATPVLAIEEDDCVFVCWDLDTGLNDPYRLDTEIAPFGSNYEYDEDGNIVITHIAFFVQLQGGDGDSDGDGEGDSDEQGEGGNGDSEDKEGDEPQDAPDDGDMEDSDKKPDSSDNDKNQDTENGDPNDQRGGNYNPDKDNIIDGNQNYRDLYQQYYDEAMAIIAAGGELPEYYKKIIEAYFGVIV